MEIKTSIIFISGIYHGPWCWENFSKYFEDLGFHTEAVKLYGCSEDPKRTTTLNNYFDIIAYTIKTARNIYKGPVIIVGHSKGGGIVQSFISQHPGEVDGAILMAPLPLRLKSQFILDFFWHILSNHETAKQMMKLLQVSVMLAMSKPVSTNILRKCALFSSRISPIEAERYAHLLAWEPVRPLLDLAISSFKIGSADIPVYIIASTGDQVFHLQEEKLLADSYGGHLTVLNDLCHDMMLDPEWEKAAETILSDVKQIIKDQ